MSWTLCLNDTLIMNGDYKSLNMIFGCLSGVNFARSSGSGWLDKMSSSTSYEHYLNIKGKELGVVCWSGKLVLKNPAGDPERVHFFDQNSALLKAGKSDQAAS